MARIKFGAMMVDARGKLGGQVFSKNRGGAYIRTKVTPVNPQSSGQTGVRALFGSISQGWSGLTDAERATWNGAVNSFQTTNIFGDIINPSGKALYQRLNQNLGVVNQPLLNTAPGLVSAPDTILTGAEFEILSQELALQGVASSPDVSIVVRSSGPVTAGTSNVRNKMRIIYTSVSNAYVNNNAFLAYVDKFGTPELGQRIFIDVSYTLSNGITTPKQRVLAIVGN